MKTSRIINNAKWIIICKMAQSLLQLLIGMLCARYLGPTNYGLINYAKSVVAFVLPLTKLGLDSTLVRELVEKPEKEGEILGTSLMMSIFSGILSVMLVLGFVSVVNADETTAKVICFLYSLSLMFRSLEMLQYWFHYQLRSQWPSLVTLIAYIAVSAFKVYLLATGKDVYWFAAAYSIECGIVGLGLLYLYQKQGIQRMHASCSMAKELFSRSKFYISASLMVTLFQNTDHVMLTLMDSEAANGVYTAAVTSAGVASFAYAAIVDSLRPVILENKKTKSPEYETSISKLYCIIVYLSLLQGGVFTIFARPIILILYGTEYLTAIPVLRILIWYLSFSQMGRIRNIWILAEEKQAILWKINLIGALANVILNVMLIPVCGASGAALASLLTQILTNFALGFVLKPLKDNNRLLLKGLDPKMLILLLRETRSNL